MQIALASRAGIRRWRVARGSGRGLLADGACPHSIDELTAAVQDFAELCQFSLWANKGPAPAPGERAGPQHELDEALRQAVV